MLTLILPKMIFESVIFRVTRWLVAHFVAKKFGRETSSVDIPNILLSKSVELCALWHNHQLSAVAGLAIIIISHGPIIDIKSVELSFCSTWNNVECNAWLYLTWDIENAGVLSVDRMTYTQWIQEECLSNWFLGFYISFRDSTFLQTSKTETSEITTGDEYLACIV